MQKKDIFPSVGSAEDRPLIRAMLQEPRAVLVQNSLQARFGTVLLLLFAFAAALSLVTARPPAPVSLTETSFVVLALHPATVLLLLGAALFPIDRRILIFAAGFVLLFLISGTWSVASGNLILPPDLNLGALVLLATGFNAVTGVLLGLGARALSHRIARAFPDITFDVALAGSALGLTLLAGMAMALAAAGFAAKGLGLGQFETLLPMVINQVLKGAAVASSLLIITLYPPDLRRLPGRLPLLLLFVAAIVIDRSLGWQSEHVVTVVLALALRLVLPVTAAVPLTLAGIVLQSLIFAPDPQGGVQGYLVSAVLFLLLAVCDLVLLNKHALERQNERVQDLLRSTLSTAQFGHFLFSSKLNRVWIDENLRLGPSRPLSGSGTELLRRMHPDDARKVEAFWNSYSPEPRQFVLRISDTAPYDKNNQIRVYRVNFLSRKSWQHGLLTLGTITDVTELHQTSSTLMNTLRRIENSKEQQHRMFAMVSHEIRTPAAILKMLSDQMDDSGDWSELGPRFALTLEQLMTLMDDLGSAVREQDMLVSNSASFQPYDFLQHLADVYRVMAQQAGIGIELQVSRVFDQPRITDVGRLHQILGNLVRNAILHSGGRHLTIGYRERFDGKTLQGVWTIEDDGGGIPNPLIPGLFDPFNRLSSGVYSKSDGMGMGMYIVKLFAENLNGSVSYDRGDLGGARFTLTLPLRAGAPQRPAPRPGADYSGLTAALVEDNQMVGEITQRLLQKVFGNVHHLPSAETLLERWQDLTPDVVITDIQLAEMDGRELILALRQQGFGGPVFVLSGTPVSDRERATLGADAVLSKPLDLEALKTLLDKARDRAVSPAL